MRGSSRVVVGADNSRVDPDVPARDTLIAAPHQLNEEPLPCPVARPPAMPVVGGLPWTIGGRNITPGAPGPSTPQHSIDHTTVIGPRPPRRTGLRARQMRFEQLPLLIGQVVTIMHTPILGQPAPRPLRDTP